MMGLGQGIADFNQYLSTDPSGFGGSWQVVQNQLNAEGANPTAVNDAKTAFVNAYVQATQIAGNDPQAVLNAAQTYALCGQTISGAATMMSEMAQAAENGGGAQVAQISQTFMGYMIGVGELAGTVSAGVGALIMGGVSAVLGALQSAGLFGTSPTGYQLGGDLPGRELFLCGSPPNLVVGYLCVIAPVDRVNGSLQVPPGSANWRSFPSPTKSADVAWFQNHDPPMENNAVTASMQWNGLQIELRTPSQDTATYYFFPRLIDAGFPSYSSVVGDKFLQALSDFRNAWVAAWCGNSEYVLNGLLPQDEPQVLVQTIRLWNRCHQGPAVELVPNMGWLAAGSNQVTGNGTYLNTLLAQAASLAKGSDLLSGDGNLLVNSGPLVTVGQTQNVQVIALKHLTAAALQAAEAKTTPVKTTSAGVVIAVSAAVVAAAGAGAWLALSRPALSLLPGEIWAALTSGASKAWSAVRGVFSESGARRLSARAPRRRCHRPMQVQAILFPRSSFTSRSARTWMRAHGYATSKAPHVTADYVRMRMADPGRFIHLRTISMGRGIKAVVGCPD